MAESCTGARAKKVSALCEEVCSPLTLTMVRRKVSVGVGCSHAAAAPKTAVQGVDPASRESAAGPCAFDVRSMEKPCWSHPARSISRAP